MSQPFLSQPIYRLYLKQMFVPFNLVCKAWLFAGTPSPFFCFPAPLPFFFGVGFVA